MKFLCHSLWYLHFHPTYEHCQHRPGTNVLYSFPAIPDFFRPDLTWKQWLQSTFLFQTILNKKFIKHIYIYADFTMGFV
jgi:hypothetical protein